MTAVVVHAWVRGTDWHVHDAWRRTDRRNAVHDDVDDDSTDPSSGGDGGGPSWRPRNLTTRDDGKRSASTVGDGTRLRRLRLRRLQLPPTLHRRQCLFLLDRTHLVEGQAVANGGSRLDPSFAIRGDGSGNNQIPLTESKLVHHQLTTSSLAYTRVFICALRSLVRIQNT